MRASSPTGFPVAASALMVRSACDWMDNILEGKLATGGSLSSGSESESNRGSLVGSRLKRDEALGAKAADVVPVDVLVKQNQHCVASTSCYSIYIPSLCHRNSLIPRTRAVHIVLSVCKHWIGQNSRNSGCWFEGGVRTHLLRLICALHRCIYSCSAP